MRFVYVYPCYFLMKIIIIILNLYDLNVIVWDLVAQNPIRDMLCRNI